MKPKELRILHCNMSHTSKLAKDFIIKNHYSHSIDGVKISCMFIICFNYVVVGAALFGQMSTTAWKKFGTVESEVLELRRLVLDDNCEKNSESYIISRLLKWISKHLKSVKVIVSYADPKYGHTGIIYKASNFKYVGTTPTDTGFQDKITGKVYHSRALRTKYKGKYKPFVIELRKKLKNNELVKITLPPKFCFTYNL